MPPLVILWGSAIGGGVLGGVLQGVAYHIGYVLLHGRGWVAPFPEGLALYRGAILGTGTGWALALAHLEHPAYAASVRHGFGIAGIALVAATALLFLALAERYGTDAHHPKEPRWRTVANLWLFLDSGTLLWAALLLGP